MSREVTAKRIDCELLAYFIYVVNLAPNGSQLGNEPRFFKLACFE
jgi:hypothetical protein